MLSLSHSRSKLPRSFGRISSLTRPLALPPVQPHQPHLRISHLLRLSLSLTRSFTLTRDMATTISAGNGKSPLEKRSVVSSFLYKFVQENGQRKAKIALFKRSGQVRTYP